MILVGIKEINVQAAVIADLYTSTRTDFSLVYHGN